MDKPEPTVPARGVDIAPSPEVAARLHREHPRPTRVRMGYGRVVYDGDVATIDHRNWPITIEY